MLNYNTILYISELFSLLANLNQNLKRLSKTKELNLNREVLSFDETELRAFFCRHYFLLSFYPMSLFLRG